MYCENPDPCTTISLMALPIKLKFANKEPNTKDSKEPTRVFGKKRSTLFTAKIDDDKNRKSEVLLRVSKKKNIKHSNVVILIARQDDTFQLQKPNQYFIGAEERFKDATIEDFTISETIGKGAQIGRAHV